MANSLIVSHSQSIGQLQGDAEGLAHRDCATLVEKPAEGGGLDVLEDETRGIGLQERVVDRHDAWVGEPRRGQGLAAESFSCRRVAGCEVQELHQHRPVQNLVAGRPEFGSGTGCQRAQESVAPLEDPPGLRTAGLSRAVASGGCAHWRQSSPATTYVTPITP